MLGTGRAIAIGPRDYALLARDLGCDPAVLEAIADVESSGFGWFSDGRIKILFEKHWFYKQVPREQRSEAVRAGLAREKWVSPAKGGYKDQDTAGDRYDLLARAIRLGEDAAYRSISVGRFQIMGFNAGTCGFATAKAMFDAFTDSEANQLRAFGTFLVNKNLKPALAERDFDKIEQVYNGGGLGGAYAKKMRTEYERLSKIAGRYVIAPPPAPRPEPVAEPAAPSPAPIPDAPMEVSARDMHEPEPEPDGTTPWVLGLFIIAAVVVAALVFFFHGATPNG